MTNQNILNKLLLFILLSPLVSSCNSNSARATFSLQPPGYRVQPASVQVLPPNISNSPQYSPDRHLRLAPIERISQEISSLAPRLVDPIGMDPKSTPGLVVAVVTEDGQRFFSFGTKTIGSSSAPESSTLFPIGSLTKIFTGLILAQLTVERRVGIDSLVSTLLPDTFPLPSPNITLRHLVTNTSGLPNYPDNLSAYRDFDRDGINDFDQFNPGRNYSKQMLSDWLSSKPRLDFSPGINSQYSNLGFGLLGLALESYLGYSSFGSLIAAKISKPLMMRSTSSPEAVNSFSANIATGYNYSGGPPNVAPIPDMGVLAGAGELISNVDDLIIFLKGLTGISRSDLSPAFRQLNLPISTVGNHTLGYGMKINQSSRGGVFALKTASTSGFTSVLAWRTRPKIGIVILANRGNFPRVNQLARHLIENAVR